MSISNFKDANLVLKDYIQPKGSQKKAYILGRMQRLMATLGNPQDSYKTIHIAGTSGKTSTCYFIASLLKESGYKVGLTVSPHIDEINERVQINLKPLSEKTFCKDLEEFISVVKSKQIEPTYFELLTAFAFWEFARQKVDYAVVEVGLGGLLDGTNVINSTEKVCIITDIGLDHTSILGKTLDKIAAQKAGIIKPGNTVFAYNQGDLVNDVIKQVCQKQGADLHLISASSNETLFQERNFSLALNAVEYIARRDKLRQLSDNELEAAKGTYIPGRLEVIKVGQKILIMDGAHNAQKMSALAKSLSALFPDEKIAALISIVQSRDYDIRADLRPLAGILSHAIVTSFSGAQDFPKQSADLGVILNSCKSAGFKSLELESSPENALQVLMRRPERVLLVTGSFYLMNHIRPVLKELQT